MTPTPMTPSTSQFVLKRPRGTDNVSDESMASFSIDLKAFVREEVKKQNELVRQEVKEQNELIQKMMTNIHHNQVNLQKSSCEFEKKVSLSLKNLHKTNSVLQSQANTTSEVLLKAMQMYKKEIETIEAKMKDLEKFLDKGSNETQ